jgi:hypothetical protein
MCYNGTVCLIHVPVCSTCVPLLGVGQVEVWKQMAKKLKPGGRVLANISDNRALAEAIMKAFPGQCSLIVLQ